MLHKDITEKIITGFYNVYNDLGYGFLERVYEHALLNELEDQSVKAEHQKLIVVKCKDKIVGEYYADIVVEGKVIVGV